LKENFWEYPIDYNANYGALGAFIIVRPRGYLLEMIVKYYRGGSLGEVGGFAVIVSDTSFDLGLFSDFIFEASLHVFFDCGSEVGSLSEHFFFDGGFGDYGLVFEFFEVLGGGFEPHFLSGIVVDECGETDLGGLGGIFVFFELVHDISILPEAFVHNFLLDSRIVGEVLFATFLLLQFSTDFLLVLFNIEAGEGLGLSLELTDGQLGGVVFLLILGNLFNGLHAELFSLGQLLCLILTFLEPHRPSSSALLDVLLDHLPDPLGLRCHVRRAVPSMVSSLQEGNSLKSLSVLDDLVYLLEPLLNAAPVILILKHVDHRGKRLLHLDERRLIRSLLRLLKFA